MKTVWHKSETHSGCTVAPVQCETPGYPNRDVNGDTMYANSHYPSERMARIGMRLSLAAGLSLDTREVARLRAELSKFEKRVVDGVLQQRATEAEFEAAKLMPPTRCECRGYGPGAFTCGRCIEDARGNWQRSEYPEVFGG